MSVQTMPASAPDGYQVILVTTGEPVGHEEHQILSWRRAWEIYAPLAAHDEYVVVATTREAVARNSDIKTVEYLGDTEISDAEALSSQAVRLLNVLIDEAAAELAATDALVQDTCARIAGMDVANPAHTTELRTRTYEERQAGASCPVVLDIATQLENLASMQDLRTDQVARIQEMQVQKLRLLNDYDFTKGDDSFQKAVLRP